VLNLEKNMQRSKTIMNQSSYKNQANNNKIKIKHLSLNQRQKSNIRLDSNAKPTSTPARKQFQSRYLQNITQSSSSQQQSNQKKPTSAFVPA
jgi:hypothetical protein